MNKYLVDFFDDELKTNNYYEGIRNFAEEKKLEWIDVLSPVVNNYEENMDNFGPYKFVDAIEDYIEQLENFDNYEDLDEVIDEMWEEDFFENY